MRRWRIQRCVRFAFHVGLLLIVLLACLVPVHFHAFQSPSTSTDLIQSSQQHSVESDIEVVLVDRPGSSIAHHGTDTTSNTSFVVVGGAPNNGAKTNDLSGLVKNLKSQSQHIVVPNDTLSSPVNKIQTVNRTVSIIAFPVFVKLHVVGSSTFTSMLRCLAMSRRLPAFNSLGNGYWDSKLCGQEHGHQAAELFKKHNARALACCVKGDSFRQLPGAKIRLIALLRHPVEKYISSLYTFVQGDAKQLLLETPPREVTMEMFNLAAGNVWGNRSAIKYITDSRKRATARLNLEKQMRVRGSMHEIRDIFRKTEHLQAFDAVGITEKYDPFLVLVELVMHWPVGTLCFKKKLHTNPLRPLTHNFEAEVIDDLSRRLAADIMLYEFATQLHSEQVAKFADFDAHTENRLETCSNMEHRVSSYCADAIEKSSRFREGNFDDGKNKCISSSRSR